jgi:hypothetical protein
MDIKIRPPMTMTAMTGYLILRERGCLLEPRDHVLYSLAEVGLHAVVPTRERCTHIGDLAGNASDYVPLLDSRSNSCDQQIERASPQASLHCHVY